MAQYYQVQSIGGDEMKPIYTTADIVLHVSSDDVGPIHLDESQQLLLQNDQVVYQTQGTPTQYQPPQAGTHYTILGEDMNQPQAQQVLQQPQQQQQQQLPPSPQHQQQQVLIHQQQQQQQTQHQVMDIQQHQMQTAYQMSQDPQHLQSAQEHQMPHVSPQQQSQQLYYAADQLVHQQQQKKVYIQQVPQQSMQQQYQPHPQQQTHQQMLHQQQPPSPQQQQQHLLQSPQHQQVQVQHQVSPSSQQQQQQQTPSQIIYRMQQQPTQLLSNTQLIVQQPSGQQVLIQQQPQQQELIMRQQMPQQRVLYNNQRVMYAPQQPAQQQQQQTIMQQTPHPQQQHIHLQTNVMHHNPPTTHLVQQARVVPAQHQPQVQQQTPTPPPQQQQMQQSVVYHQIQVPKQNLPQTSTHSQQQQHLQLQQQHPQQQSQMPNGATIIRAAGIARGGKMPRGALIARMPGGIPRGTVFNATGAIGGGGSGGQTLRTPRPRCSTSAGGTTGRGRGGRAGRGAASPLAAGRGVQAAAAGAGAMVMTNNPQLATLQQAKIITQGQGGIRQVYRTQLTDGNIHQQVHLVQTQPRMPAVGARFKTPTVGVQQQQSQSPQQSSPSSSSASGSGGGNFDLDLEDSIQAVFVKKDGQKQAPGVALNQSVAANSGGQIAGTTLTTYFAAKDDEESRLIKTQNGCMTLAEYKKRNANSQIMQTTNSCIKPLQQTPGGVKISLPAASPSIPIARVAPQKHNVTKEQAGTTTTTTTVAASQVTNRPPAGSSVYQTSHNNYEIQTQHVLQNRAGQQMAEKDRNSAKMLVILVSGEQRLITFTLPRESCTVQDLLEQVGVPFDDNTTIQCVENPGANIDFVVTVGFSVQESASELISRAEQSLQISRQQESLQQNSAASATGASGVSTTGSTSANTTTESSAQNTTPAASSAATSTNLATVATAAPSETSVKEQQSVNVAKQTTTNSSTSKAAEEPTAQRKLIQGYYAICQSCGFSGYDHFKCERCKRVFHEPPKKVAIKQASSSSANAGCFSNSSSSASSESSSSASSLPMEKKRHGADGLLTSSQRSKSSAYNPNGTSSRGRGGSQGARGRGTRSGRRPVEVEPVILTLSSDEEDDESSNKGMSNYGTLSKAANPLPSSLMTAYKPLPFESNIPDTDESLIYHDFKRDDVTDLSGCTDKLNCSLPCKLIRIGSYRFEPVETVVITSKGIRIVAPLESNQSETFPLHIHKKEVVKVIGNFSKTSDSMLCFYTLRNCAEYIRNSLKMLDVAKPLEGVTYFTTNGSTQMRKIIIQFQMLSEQSKSVIRSIWEFLDEISDSDAQDLLQRAAECDKKLDNNKSNSDNLSTTTQLQPNEIRQLIIYPPGKGGISINTEDYMCLATDQYLNDIIIDFYLKWVHDHIIPEAQKDRTHIFSTFFYKRLTTLTRHIQQDKDVKQTAAQKRHARVQNWTKNVNIFEKDFVIIPINEQSHWFLAIICFPRLKGPVTFETGVPVELQPIKKTKGKKVSLQIGNTTITPLSKRDSGNVLNDICAVGDDDSERDEAEGDDSDLASEESDFENSSSNTTSNSQPSVPVLPGASSNNVTHQSIKQPLILIFDSLAGASRSRVVATLRDYLSCEYKIKIPEAPLHMFNKDNMPGHCVKVPQQNNFTDCGLYLLQYVEQFFKDPIRDYRVPIKQLSNWFDTLTVTRKREDISNLLQKLMNERNGPNNKVILPEIPFPTLNGILVEPDGFNIEFEEEEMEDDDDDETQTGDVDDISTDDTSKSKTPIKMPLTPPSTTPATTLPALVPTQARKIVLKRRMQVLGSSVSDTSPQSIGNTSSPCTAGTTPTSAQQGQLQRSTNMTKIRKVDP